MIFDRLVGMIFKGVNRYLLLASVLTILVGATITVFSSPLAEEVEREAEEIRKIIENLDYMGILTLILWNNLSIMVMCYFGGILIVLTPVFGAWAIGRPVGTIILRGPFELLFILAVYGILELSGFTLAVMSGYRLTWYVFNRVFKKRADSIKSAFRETGIVIFYSLTLITTAAVIESYLIRSLQRFPEAENILPFLLAFITGIAFTAVLVAMLILAVKKAGRKNVESEAR